MRWNRNCPPERANVRYPSASSTSRSGRDSCAARVRLCRSGSPLRGVSPTTSYTYSDASGVRTVTVTNPESEATVYRFDIASNRLTSVTNALSQTTTYKYDSSGRVRSEEHTSELQSLMRNSYAVFCLKKKKQP